MAITRKTPATTPASLGLPQDPMIADVCVLATIRISTSSTDVANPANLAGIKNSTNTTSQVDLANVIDPNDQPLSPRVNTPLVPRTEGFVNVEQPLGTTTDTGP
uniref:Uncharacterized protein n=1 Tax=Cannabis sativa TaxID=3483 RepID=A0A803QS57_CANSA